MFLYVIILVEYMRLILRRFFYIILGVCFFVQLYIVVRVYWFTSCVIPTFSMSPTLIEGDYIVANLQIPGRRVLEEDANGNLIAYREEGARRVSKGDVVVFNFPYSESKTKMILSMKLFYCKRCVAIPGETYRWQWDNKESSIYLPGKGDCLQIDSANYLQYCKCIEYETGQRMKMENGQVYLSDSLLTSYSFQHDYYFMQGDHTEDSYDSRFWGILPDDFILGVGEFIWFSKDKKADTVRWERIFTKL